jgi:hypothetical protein
MLWLHRKIMVNTVWIYRLGNGPSMTSLYKLLLYFAIFAFIWSEHRKFSTWGVYTWIFCFAEDNKMLTGIENTIMEPDWKKIKTNFRVSRVVERAATYCLPLHYICLGCLPRQQIFRKIFKLSYYFYIVKICKIYVAVMHKKRDILNTWNIIRTSYVYSPCATSGCPPPPPPLSEVM